MPSDGRFPRSLSRKPSFRFRPASDVATDTCRTKAHSEKHTQLAWIIRALEGDGQISRSQCLSMFISRLASRIDDLERQGWVFAAEKQGRDYVYRVERRPAPEQIALSL
jgi:hypothetical protein